MQNEVQAHGGGLCRCALRNLSFCTFLVIPPLLPTRSQYIPLQPSPSAYSLASSTYLSRSETYEPFLVFAPHLSRLSRPGLIVPFCLLALTSVQAATMCFHISFWWRLSQALCSPAVHFPEGSHRSPLKLTCSFVSPWCQP